MNSIGQRYSELYGDIDESKKFYKTRDCFAPEQWLLVQRRTRTHQNIESDEDFQ